ncbi:MAG: cytochrome c [Hellea sp.]|nr:cytochrome c [Hellea sp.]
MLRGCITAAALTLVFTLPACQKTQGTNFEIETGSSFIELGQDIAKTHCAVCHNTEKTGTSPRKDAPPLRAVLANYNSVSLADDFREHIHVGHPDMPDFEFSVKEIDGLIAYLRSIQETD